MTPMITMKDSDSQADDSEGAAGPVVNGIAVPTSPGRSTANGFSSWSAGGAGWTDGVVSNLRTRVDAAGRAAADRGRALQRAAAHGGRRLGQSATVGGRRLGQAATVGGRRLGQVAADSSRRLSAATASAVMTFRAAVQKSLAEIGSSPLVMSDAGGGIGGSAGDGAEDVETALTGDTAIISAVHGAPRVKGEATDEALVTGVRGTLVFAVSAAAAAAAVCSYVMVAGRICDVASFLVAVLSPVVAYQKAKLANLGNLRRRNNALRSNMNRFTAERVQLKQWMDELSKHAAGLNTVESDLKQLAHRAGTQVDSLVSIVHDVGQLREDIKVALESRVAQTLITAVLQSDRDRDFAVSAAELQALKVRLSNCPGVQFREDRFDDLLRDDGHRAMTLSDACRVVRNLLDDAVPAEESIFVLEPSAVLRHEQQPPPRQQRQQQRQQPQQRQQRQQQQPQQQQPSTGLRY